MQQRNDISLMGNLMEKGGNGGERLFIVAVQNGRQQGVQVLSLSFRQARKQRGGRQPFQKCRNRKGIEHKVAEPDIRGRGRLAEEFDRLQQVIDKPSSGVIRKGPVTVGQYKAAA